MDLYVCTYMDMYVYAFVYVCVLCICMRVFVYIGHTNIMEPVASSRLAPICTMFL